MRQYRTVMVQEALPRTDEENGSPSVTSSDGVSSVTHSLSEKSTSGHAAQQDSLDVVRQPADYVVLHPIRRDEHTKKEQQAAQSSSRSSLHRLRFRQLGVLGRTKEKAILQNCVANAACGTREMILIRGVSGTGKTCLASSLRGAVEQMGGCMVRGQCDAYQREEPYGDIAGACRELCGTIIQRQHGMEVSSSSSQPAPIRSGFSEISQEESRILLRIVPELSEILSPEGVKPCAAQAKTAESSEESSKPLMIASASLESDAAKAGLHHAFRKLFQIICQFMGPLVVVLDDLQWTDVPSAELMKALITDQDNSRLILIGLYRSDEVDDQHTVCRMRDELKASSILETDNDFGLTEIAVGNLSIEEIAQILKELLSIPDDDDNKGASTSLAEVCHRRTMGNAVFLLAFIKKLKDRELLRFNLERYQWEWDVAEILSHTRASTNVVDIMKSSLRRLPINVQRRLSIVSFLGATFQASTISQVWDDLKHYFTPCEDDEADDAMAEEWMKLAENEGFIERLPGNGNVVYQWGHDKIQEASMALIAVHEIADLKRRIGESLLRRLEDPELESKTFVIANLLNEGTHDASPESISRLIEWNLRAAKKGLELVAYTATKKYANRGVDLLPENCWTTDSHRAFELYSVAVQAEAGCLEFDEMKRHYEIVIAQPNFSVLDKLPVHFPMINYLGGSVRHQEALDLILTLLKDLDYALPHGKISMGFYTVGRLLKLKRRINRMTLDDIRKLPKMTDPRDVQIMALLVKLGSHSYGLANRLHLPLSVLACAQLTLKKGICEHSPAAFALLALIAIGVLDDIQFGYKCGKVGQHMDDSYKFSSTTAKTRLFVNIFSRAWKEPISYLPASLGDAHRLGLAIGDTEHALTSIWQKIVAEFQSGQNLQVLEAECRKYNKQMKEYNLERIASVNTSYWLAIMKLVGNESTTQPLDGVEATLSIDRWLRKHETDANVHSVVRFLQSYLDMIFGDHQEGGLLAIQKGDTYGAINPGHYILTSDTFARAASLYALARQTNLRMYKKEAKRLHTKVQNWVKIGNPNVLHYEKLLDAEEAALHEKYDAADGLYQSAVTQARNGGFIGDAAYFSERYAEHLLVHRQKTDAATFHLKEAHRLYSVWGAHKKAELLRTQYNTLWPRPNEIILSTNP